jgi:serine/threonine-protein kinase
MPEQSDPASSRPPTREAADVTTRVGPRTERGARLPVDPPETEVSSTVALDVDGRYHIQSELGRGSMGVVHLAQDTWLDRPVALKMIAPVWANDGEIIARFQREAKALASIRNQYVVQVYAFGLHLGAYFFAMEYVAGRSLKQILSEHRMHGDAIPVHRSLTILNRVAQGIDAVHAAGIVHRDVKPSNIVIEQDTGRPVLVDFGLAVPGDDPAAALAMGTPFYMAPEQGGVGVPGSTVTGRADVYALGITAFEMLSGELPFTGVDRAQLMRQHARKTPPSLSSRRADLAPFDKAMARALAKDPEDRYPSCTAFTEVLAAASERWVNSMLPTLPPPPVPAAARAADVGVLPPLPPLPVLLPPRSLPQDARPFHVLVVDDSPVFRKFTVQATQLALFRQRKGRDVVVQGAGSGNEAIERAAVQPPDLVLLDFDMPGLDGADTLSRLRALPGGDGARVVVLSGRVGAADRWRFAVLGVSDFVMKPIEFQQLVDRLEGIARRHDEAARHRSGTGS